MTILYHQQEEEGRERLQNPAVHVRAYSLLCPTLFDSMDCSLPGSSVHGILQARYWSGLPFPSPGDHPDPGVEPGSPALQADSPLSVEKEMELTPVLLSGKSHGRRSLVGYHPWGPKESDTAA